MAELRWILLFLGAVALVAIYLYTRRSGKNTLLASDKERREPIVDGAADSGEVDEAGEDQPDPNAELAKVDGDSKIVTVRLMAKDKDSFPAEKLILLFRELGLQHGEFGIFHRMPDSDPGRAYFSVANLVEPGSFDLTKLKSDAYPGVSLFMVLPVAGVEGVSIFDDMLQTARTLAQRMDGELLDEQGSRLSVQRERYMREEVISFDHHYAVATDVD
jgi:cell division protein ZipA